MTTRMILVRHGETEWNKIRRFQGVTDIPLNDRGRIQAGYAREALANTHIDAVYASPLSRAVETASIICRDHAVDTIHREPGFMEQNVGDWEGLTYEEITARWPDELDDWLYNPARLQIPKGERFAEVQQRAVSAFWRVADAHPGQTVLIASHMVCLSTILDHFAGVDLNDIWQRPIYNAGLNVIEVDEADSEPVPIFAKAAGASAHTAANAAAHIAAGANSDTALDTAGTAATGATAHTSAGATAAASESDLFSRPARIVRWNYGDHLPEEERRQPRRPAKYRR